MGIKIKKKKSLLHPECLLDVTGGLHLCILPRQNIILDKSISTVLIHFHLWQLLYSIGQDIICYWHLLDATV